MQRSFVSSAALVVSLAIAACGGSTTPAATPTSAPTPTTAAELEVREVPDVLYQEDPDGTQHELTVYAPAGDGGPWPVAMMIHQWDGDMNARPSAVAAEGVVVFVPTTRNPSVVSFEALDADYTAIVERMACAVRFARAEAEAYGGDPSNLSLYGESMGANISSLLAFASPEVAEGCVAPSGPAVPENLVLFEGDWLVFGFDSLSNVWDDFLQEDGPRMMEAGTPWSYLGEAARVPVHILDSDDLFLSRQADDADRWLPLRDPTGDFRRDLEELGAFDDGVVGEREVQRVLYGRLQSLGYRVAFHDLPDSRHAGRFSEAALKVAIDAILSRP